MCVCVKNGTSGNGETYQGIACTNEPRCEAPMPTATIASDIQREADDVDRHDPEDAAHDERAPAESSERLLLPEGERGDQEAAQHEEERDAVPALEPAPEPVGAGVVEDDHQRRDRPEAVERREEPEPRASPRS